MNTQLTRGKSTFPLAVESFFKRQEYIDNVSFVCLTRDSDDENRYNLYSRKMLIATLCGTKDILELNFCDSFQLHKINKLNTILSYINWEVHLHNGTLYFTQHLLSRDIVYTVPVNVCCWCYFEKKGDTWEAKYGF